LAASGDLFVNTTTLDDYVFLDDAEPPAVVKIDVEGAEALVLRGARRTIAQFRPVLLVATHGPDVHSEAIGLLRTYGYKISGLDGGDLCGRDEILAQPI
jgi:hypothetical protein